MALPGSGIVDQGLKRIGINASAVGGGAAIGAAQTVSRYIMSMAVDDATGNFEAAHTAINGAGGTARTIASSFDAMLDALPTQAGQTVSHVLTIGTGNGNFTIRGVALHDNTSNNTGSGSSGLTDNVTNSSATLVAGIAGQSIGKTNSFSLKITIAIAYTDNS